MQRLDVIASQKVIKHPLSKKVKVEGVAVKIDCYPVPILCF
jgi:hypothetical protein